MYSIHERTGNVGEYNISSTNTTDNIVDKIKEYELSFNDNDNLKESKEKFALKNIGIKNNSDVDVTVRINNRPFVISANSALNLPRIEMITEIIFETLSAEVSIRYVY